MNNLHRACLFLICLSILTCSSADSIYFDTLKSGIWRGALDIGEGEEIPFLFNLTEAGESYQLIFYNGNEKIFVDDVSTKGDSLIINMPVFNSSFFLIQSGRKNLAGIWQNFNRTNEYKVPFSAVYGVSDRFIVPSDPLMDELGSKKWGVTFSPNTDDSTPAIGLFTKVEKGIIHGSFATEKGDYRYLEGLYCDSLLRLSCFDGAHAFLFKAKKQRDGSLLGNFWSGNSWKEPWTALPKNDAYLSHPDSLTKLSVPSNAISFEFPDLSGKLVSLNDALFKDKAIIIQVMGSWCPNCADECILYRDLYSKFKGQGLEIIALCFESTRDHEQAVSRVRKFKENIGFDYETLVAGYASKKEATKVLGFVDEITSFPTSIFIDKKGVVQRVHTGFYGPGTGSYYEDYVRDLQNFIPTLLED